MKVIFEEWNCSYLPHQKKKEIEENIKKEIISAKDGMTHIPQKLTVHIFKIPPAATSLKCYGFDDKGNKLIEYEYPISGGDSKFHFPKG